LQRMILIVDDDVSVLRLLDAHLTGLGWTVQVRESAVGLEETIRALRPDVLLCDLCMPDRDAVEFLLSRTAGGSCDVIRNTPVVIMSAHDLVESAVDSDMDVAGVIRKPLDFDKLTMLIESALDLAHKETTR